MKSERSPKFRAMYKKLPADIKERAEAAYEHFQRDPHHPSLHFKKLHTRKPYWSVRINDDYRAIGSLQGDTILWGWIGPHNEYIEILKSL